MSGPLFTFDATFADGSPRRYAGMWRPDRRDAERCYDETPFEETIHSMQGNEAASFAILNWERGVFDRPLYHVEEFERA